MVTVFRVTCLKGRIQPGLSKATAMLSWVILLLGISAGALARDGQYFAVSELPSSGRSVAAELADLDGDGRRDLFVVVLSGLPPSERRTIYVYLQRADGSFPPRPNHSRSMPRWSAVYDVADVRPDSAGEELVALRPDGVSILSLAGPEAPSWHLKVPGPSTLAAGDDERGLEPYPLVFPDFGDEPWILVPQLGQLTALSPSGAVRATLDVPRRANYFVMPQTDLIALESDFQLFVDVPRLMVGDIDGDGRADIASATRHQLAVFLRGKDGGFSSRPDLDIPLELVAPRDHIRGTGGVITQAGDINGDGRMDLLVSHVKGGFTDSTTSVYVYLNRGGSWNLGAPDQAIVEPDTLASNALFNLLGDERLELVRVSFRFGVLELIETLLSRKVDVSVEVHRFSGSDGFETRPSVRKKLELPISFETFRPVGFMPTARYDLNDDGYIDFVSSGNGKKLEIYIGGPEGPFERRPVRQAMSTAGVIHFADWSGDGLEDFVLFDPHNFDVPVRLGRNLGNLPTARKDAE